MDQATQAILGAVTAQALFTRQLGRRAWIVGAAAGLAPDADMAFLALADPLFPVEVHRSYSHALAVTPLGAAFITLLFLPFAFYRSRWKAVFGAAFVAWGTHAPLDCCTSYGVLWFWPFDGTWLAWDLISIIDPVFTLCLLVGLVLAVRRGRARPAWIALACAVLYLAVGGVQRNRALDVQRRLAVARGSPAAYGRVLPSMGSVLVWRSLYRDNTDHMHVDTIAVVPFTEPRVHEAGSVACFSPADLPSDVPDPERLRTVFARYYAYADGFTARTPGMEALVGDMRIGIEHGFEPIWGMRIEGGEEPRWVERIRESLGDLGTYMRVQLGLKGDLRPLEEILRQEESRGR